MCTSNLTHYTQPRSAPNLTNTKDHTDALTLVTVHQTTGKDTSSETAEPNHDLRRAKELVDLHCQIKEKHADGRVDADLGSKREEVRRVLRELGV